MATKSFWSTVGKVKSNTYLDSEYFLRDNVEFQVTVIYIQINVDFQLRQGSHDTEENSHCEFIFQRPFSK